ncbi:hypothetical protein [Xenorhabdus sp. BG5]|uniref:hypothetical protein n=1 Tax=Xenorhabdus sp. BG5 TaxID=2782014 RepID=UPI00187F2EF2|nr:hypothetical protein [Xenorhabdus sp. BG5]MBE8595043.1 hypothetical protein [Xenorhabdus sp. BG5]
MSVKSQIRDHLPNGRLKSYRRVGKRFSRCKKWFNKSPFWYRNLVMTRPERREVKRLISKILHGYDPEGIVFPVHNKPVEWFY